MQKAPALYVSTLGEPLGLTNRAMRMVNQCQMSPWMDEHVVVYVVSVLGMFIHQWYRLLPTFNDGHLSYIRKENVNNTPARPASVLKLTTTTTTPARLALRVSFTP